MNTADVERVEEAIENALLELRANDEGMTSVARAAIAAMTEWQDECEHFIAPGAWCPKCHAEGRYDKYDTLPAPPEDG